MSLAASVHAKSISDQAPCPVNDPNCGGGGSPMMFKASGNQGLSGPCSVRQNQCNSGEIAVMSLSTDGNLRALGGLSGDSTYSNKVCCGVTNLANTCWDASTILLKMNQAHGGYAYAPTQNQPVKVCLKSTVDSGGYDCQYVSGNVCPADKYCVVKTSAALSGYFKSCQQSYLMSVCCKKHGDDGLDHVPPSAVSDLYARGENWWSIRIEWTEPGDDGMVGQPASYYDVRYSLFPISEANWDDPYFVHQVTNEPSPWIPGLRNFMSIIGLEPSTHYYIRMKVGDEVPNWSPLSNQVDSWTPAISSAPVAEFYGTPLSGLAPLDVQFFDQSSNVPTVWSWQFGDYETSTEQNPLHRYENAGPYSVSLTASNAAGSSVPLVKFQYIHASASCPDDMKVSYQYSDRNWVSEIMVEYIVQVPDVKTFRENYLYDAAGNLDVLDDHEASGNVPTVYKSTDFGYDNLNRLTSAAGVDTGAGYAITDRAGRYADSLAWTYDKVGNIKTNYELEYCYMQSGVETCGVNVNNVDNNRLTSVRVTGAYPYSMLTTKYGYDQYGNTCFESSFQEVPVGAVSTDHSNGVKVLFADLPAGIANLKVLYFHNTNSIFAQAEKAEWNGNSEAYDCGTNCQESPYWDGTPLYSSFLRLKRDNEVGTSSLISGGQNGDFYDNDLWSAYDNLPFIKQYFRAYRLLRTNYKFADNANLLLSSWECAGTELKSCMKFTYDHAGNRISKTTCSSVDINGYCLDANGGHQTLYITQGNNVITEQDSDVAFTCPYILCTGTATSCWQ